MVMYNEVIKIDSYRKRDEYMVKQADRVMCITTAKGTPGTMAVYRYAESLGKEVWLWRG